MVEENSKYVSLGKAAKVYGVSRRTLLNWVYEGKVEAIKTAGNHYRVDLAKILSYRDNSRTGDITVEAKSEKRIMLVDDDAVTVELLSGIIGKRYKSVQILKYSNGYDALLDVKDNQPEVIILDLNMPKMDGFEFARAIFDNKETADISIVVLSSYITDEAVKELSAFGVNDFIEKIDFKEKIISKLDELIKAK